MTSRPGPRISLLAAAALALLLWANACSDGGTEPQPADPPRPTAVAVTPTTTQLAALGETIRLRAEVRDQNGNVMTGTALTWSSSDATVAAVDGAGLVTAAGNGTATITVAAGSASGTAAVSVAQTVSAVAVSPEADTLVAFGDTVRLVAEATDANGHSVAGVAFEWSSSDTLVAVVDGAGLVTAVDVGKAEVMATAAEITGRAGFTVVAPEPAIVAVTPDTVALTALDQTVQLAAEAHDQVGRVMEGVHVSWSSADTTIAAVDSAGVVTAIGSGETTVAATTGEVSGTALMAVMQSAGSVVVSPSADTVAPGDTLRLVAEAFDANGHRVEGAEFTWSSDNVAVARVVEESGLVTGTAEGTATITATAGSASGTSEITVENPDRAALVALYHATDGPNWIDNENWLTDAPLGAWYGVRTDGTDRVVSLDLSGRWDADAREWVEHGLSGPIPGELGRLINLTRLSLHSNELGGPIPGELGRLANLKTLHLARNELTGPIPPEMGRLANLARLRLDSNELTGPIPPSLGALANLTELNLFWNELTGPIPPELGGLANLTGLSLGSNGLTGPIPPEMGRLANLTWVDLGSNGLTGSIPPELGGLANLWRLDLDANELTGPIPAELGRLANLARLRLDSNELTGPIPPSLGALANLTELNLFWNELTGPIPPELGGLANLTGLSLGSNGLTGPIPPEMGRLANLTWVDLGSNGLTGSIPPELGGLANLWRLDLDANELTGPIPAELGRLANLENLNLSSNELSGPLPQSLLRLDRLRLFYVWGNEGVCVPGTSAFFAWLRGIEYSEDDTAAIFCNADDVDALRQLYETAGGMDWPESAGWLGDGAVEEWHGVTTDSLGHVTQIDLQGNGLRGSLTGKLASLGELTDLVIENNPELSGRLPVSIASLPLQVLRYARTALCEPIQADFRLWLKSIETHAGTGVDCPPLSRLSVEPLRLVSQAGKPGAARITVEALDERGSPVAGAKYRWSTDRHSGWVYPSQGFTDELGRFKTTWVAGWPGEGILSLIVEDESSQVTEELATLSTTPNNHPNGAAWIHIDNRDNPSAGYSIDMTPLTEPTGTYYAAIVWDGGYTGLHPGRSRHVRSLRFSVWDAPGHGSAELIDKASEVQCRPFGGEGTGVTCEMQYPWTVESTYRFEVTEEEMGGGSAMTLHVTDLAAASRRFVATIRFARRAKMTNFGMFVEDFVQRAPHCLARQVRSAAIRRPRARIGGAWVALDEMMTGRLGRWLEDPWNPGTPGCANLAVREHASGLELVIGGQTASDPNASPYYTIPRN